MSPIAARALAGFDNQKVHALALQVPTHGQSGLSGTDNDHRMLP
jgi:hypothetical protein